MNKTKKTLLILCIIIVSTLLLTFAGIKVNREIRYQRIVDKFEEQMMKRDYKYDISSLYSTYTVVKNNKGEKKLLVEVYATYNEKAISYYGCYLEGTGNFRIDTINGYLTYFK